MKSNDRQVFLDALEQMKPPDPSANFEQRLHQDWERMVLTSPAKSTHGISEVLTFARTHHKLVIFLAMMAIIASVLLGQGTMGSAEDDLRHIDALSELSLSTM